MLHVWGCMVLYWVNSCHKMDINSKHVTCVVEHNEMVVFEDKIQVLYYWHASRLISNIFYTTNRNVLQIANNRYPVKLKFFLSTPWRCIRELDVLLHSFLTIALHRRECWISRPGLFNPEKERHYQWLQGWCRPQSRSEKFGEANNLFLLTGFEPQTMEF